MKFAIDRYYPGKEKEVSANDFYNTYIPGKQRRFFCPECNEPVFWRSRGGRKLNDEFYHQTKTDSSPECEKRVDGNCNLTVSQRVGLAQYLTLEYENMFQLSISFPALGSALLEHATFDGASLCISTGEKQKKTPINGTNFYANETTLVPIDFIPSGCKNFDISVASNNWQSSIRRKWSEYSDGFENGRAVFSCTGTAGKKVHRGDSITVGKKYWVIAKDFTPYYREIVVSRVGTILLNRQVFSVYEMTVAISTDADARFSIINNYLKSIFGVWLVDQTPSIVPLWPPMVETDIYIPVGTPKQIFCAVSSGNVEPAVYTYVGSNSVSIPVQHENNIHTVALPTITSETIVSVDRKYVGREICFEAKTIPVPSVKREFALSDAKGNPLQNSELYETDLAKSFQMDSNARFELVIEYANKTYQEIPIRELSASIPCNKSPSFLHFVSEGAEFLSLSITNQRVSCSSIAIAEDISKHSHGAFIPAPIWINHFISNQPEQTKALLINQLQGGMIRRGLLTYLLLLKEGKQYE